MAGRIRYEARIDISLRDIINPARDSRPFSAASDPTLDFTAVARARTARKARVRALRVSGGRL
jgi:hypothetical protein